MGGWAGGEGGCGAGASQPSTTSRTLETASLLVHWARPPACPPANTGHSPTCMHDALQDVLSMLEGNDAAVLHTLQALGVPFKLVRVWKDDQVSRAEQGRAAAAAAKQLKS